jgi:chromate transporter
VQVFWPQGFAGNFDVIAAMIGMLALLALFRYKVGVIPVITVAGVLGLLCLFVKPLIELTL